MTLSCKLKYQVTINILLMSVCYFTPSTNANNFDTSTVKGSGPFIKAVADWKNKTPLKIVGGKNAAKEQFPWQVSLSVSWIADPLSAHFCGGSIISREWILTAAHCIENTSPMNIHVVAGATVIDEAIDRVNVESIYMINGYTSASNGKDIALIKLTRPLIDNPKIRPIELDNDPSIITDSSLFTVTGWGATTEDGAGNFHLQFIDNVPYIDSKTCNRPTFYDGQIQNDMICSGFIDGGKDSCQGDSGGPHTTVSNGKPIQTGIVSWGYGCAQPQKPGVYTRISLYSEDIKTCIENINNPDCRFK